MARSALDRAGRCQDAIRRVKKAIRLLKGESRPKDWTILRVAHHGAARHWRERLQDRQPSTDPDQFWEELEIRLLRSEAEAVVPYDRVFPAEPFAR